MRQSKFKPIAAKQESHDLLSELCRRTGRRKYRLLHDALVLLSFYTPDQPDAASQVLSAARTDGKCNR